MAILLERLPLFLHLLGFALFVGGAFAQQELLKASAKAIPVAVRDTYESLAAAIVTKAEVPGAFVQLISGVWFVVRMPELIKQPWLHVKLTAVVLLLVLSHLEMFNARKIARLRREQGDAAAAEIDARKKRHALMGAVGTVLVVVVVVAVVFFR